MAAYPSVALTLASQQSTEAGIQVDRADDGTVRARRLYSSDLQTFSLVHEYITAAERDQILTHYAAHRAVTFAFTWPATGVTYNAMLYAAAPQVQPLAGSYWRVTVTLTGR